MNLKCLVAAAIALVSFGIAAAAAVPQVPAGHDPASPSFGPEVICAHYSDVSPPLREMVPAAFPERESFELDELEEVPNRTPFPSRTRVVEGQPVDPAVQAWNGSVPMPAPIMNFPGQPNVAGYVPPDTQGDVGPNHYVQWVNVTLAIFSKTGQSLWGPYPGNTLWQGMGGPCDGCNNGDPIVLYDRYADRWLVSQFVLPNASQNRGPFFQYVAVSTTPDPLGSWHRYWFKWSDTKMNDYPKVGIWPDGYYFTYNQFDMSTGGYAGAGVIVLNRQSLVGGAPEGQVDGIRWDLGLVDPNFFSILPAHAQGATQPEAGAPCPLMELEVDGVSLWNVHVDWTNPSASTIGNSGNPDKFIPAPAFNYNLCVGFRQCIRQPGTLTMVDGISDRLMYRLHYRRFPSYSSMVVNHTVDADGTKHGGLRWYEFRDSGTGWSLYQSGTYAPDADSRWMGSVNMDRMGNIAAGYSVSSAATYPSIRYAGHSTTDPLGVMGQGEQSLATGAGSQIEVSRWGDYSTMSMDPTDDCTFWYTTEYYTTTSYGNWVTRIGSFKFPGCGGPSIVGVTATPTSGTSPLAVTFAASATGDGLTYSWVFGDGATGSGSTVSHTYTRAGTFTAKVTVSDGTGQSATSDAPAITVTVPPPAVTSMSKQVDPFRFVCNGSNLQQGLQVFIGSDGQPWSDVQWKSATKILLKGGNALKGKVPKGQPTVFTFVNPDGGRCTFTFAW